MPKEGASIFFEKKFFRPKIFKKPLFLAIFGQKFDKSSEPAVLDRRRDAYNGAKWPQYNPFEMGEKNFKISPPKNSKNWFFGPKNGKNDQKIENFSKFFLVGIDLEWSKTCFKTKISISKIFSLWKFFFKDSRFFSKNWWPKNRKFFEKKILDSLVHPILFKSLQKP